MDEHSYIVSYIVTSQLHSYIGPLIYIWMKREGEMHIDILAESAQTLFHLVSKNAFIMGK